MIRIIFAGIAAIALTSIAQASGVSACTALEKLANEQQIAVSPVESRQVTGQGRLYFHTAPSTGCRTQSSFVIPKDKLVVYAEYDGWACAMFVNTKNGTTTDGWVRADRLKYAGRLTPN